ncbi:MAG TPA: 50S ribosomal protein L21e [Candidatus Thermoplasmatota archaeon]
MARATKGTRKGTRSLFRQPPRERGKTRITRMLQKFEAGDKASIRIDSRVRGGQPHNTFNGMTGVIVGAQGSAYLLRIRIGGKMKVVVAHPAHLRRPKAA